jgi:uncharacterized protein with PQ loop repeat
LLSTDIVLSTVAGNILILSFLIGLRRVATKDDFDWLSIPAMVIPCSVVLWMLYGPTI